MPCTHLPTCKRDKSRARPPLCLLHVATAQDVGPFFPKDRPHTCTLVVPSPIPHPQSPIPTDDRDDKPEEPDDEPEEEPKED